MKKGLFTLFAAMGLCVAAETASATVFYIDEFTVTEGTQQVTQTYWQDTFSDGAPPADQVAPNVDVNLYNRVYLTRPQPGLPGPEEANGKLALDTAQGYLNIGVVNPVQNLIQRARINSSTNSANNSALVASEQISVTGLFDLIEPQKNHELFSIRLTDWQDASTPEGVELAVIKTGAGEWIVQLRQAIIDDHWDPLESWVLGSIADIADYEQISLSLFNDPFNDSVNDPNRGKKFSSEFTLIDLDGLLPAQTFTSSTTGLMYQYEEWLRPEFTVRLQVVPEPATLALLMLGLAGIGCQRSKSKV